MEKDIKEPGDRASGAPGPGWRLKQGAPIEANPFGEFLLLAGTFTRTAPL